MSAIFFSFCSIRIHRVVLAAASDYFTAAPIFDGNNYSEFTLDAIDAVDGQMIRMIVDFCYSGYIELTEDNVGTLIAVASYYQFDLLAEKCWQYRNDTLVVSNAVDVFLIADKYSNPDLREKAFALVCKNPPSNFRKLDQRQLGDVLKSDLLEAKEDNLFTMLMDWYECDKEEGGKYMPTLLQHIRLEHITDRFLTENLKPSFENLNCSESLIVELQKRTSNPSMYVRTHRSWPHRTLYSVFSTFETENEVRVHQIHVERYNSCSNSFDVVLRCEIGEAHSFGMVIHLDKLFFLGGRGQSGHVSSDFIFKPILGNR